jgi:transcriptional regulator with XRE-family HTH domain
MTFAQKLKAERERLGLTQNEAAALCSVSPRAWWRWENGEGDPLIVTREGVLARLKKTQPHTNIK